MLSGTYFNKIDEKGRLRLPAELRKDMGELLFITRGPKNSHLILHTEKNLEKLKAMADKISVFSTNVPLNSVFGNGQEIACDSQGRILIPAQFRKFFPGGDVAIVGSYNKLELWEQSKWEAESDIEIPQEAYDALSQML